MGKFVANFDAALSTGDPGAVADALKVLNLPSDEKAVAAALKPTGGPEGHTAAVVASTSGLLSSKVTVRVQEACMTPKHYVRLLWLKDATTGKVLAVRELTKLKTDKPELVQASVPKGCVVVPCTYVVPYGVFRGDAYETA